MQAVGNLASAALTLLVGISFVALVTDSPPWGDEWRDVHIQLGLLVGAAAAVDAVAILQRRRLSPPALAWISSLALGGLVLFLSCWLLLGIRAAT